MIQKIFLAVNNCQQLVNNYFFLVKNDQKWFKKSERRPSGQLLFLLVDIVDAEEGTGEGGGFAEGYEEGFVDLTLGVDEDAAKEQDEAADGEDCGGD